MHIEIGSSGPSVAEQISAWATLASALFAGLATGFAAWSTRETRRQAEWGRRAHLVVEPVFQEISVKWDPRPHDLEAPYGQALHTGVPSGKRLQVQNLGLGPATNIRVSFDVRDDGMGDVMFRPAGQLGWLAKVTRRSLYLRSPGVTSDVTFNLVDRGEVWEPHCPGSGVTTIEIPRAIFERLWVVGLATALAGDEEDFGDSGNPLWRQPGFFSLLDVTISWNNIGADRKDQTGTCRFKVHYSGGPRYTRQPDGSFQPPIEAFIGKVTLEPLPA